MGKFTVPELCEPQLLGRGFARFFVVHSTGRFGAYLPEHGDVNQFGLLGRNGQLALIAGHSGWRFLPRLTSHDVCYPYFHGDYLDMGSGQIVFVDVSAGVLRTANGQILPVSNSYLNGSIQLLGNHWESLHLV